MKKAREIAELVKEYDRQRKQLDDLIGVKSHVIIEFRGEQVGSGRMANIEGLKDKEIIEEVKEFAENLLATRLGKLVAEINQLTE